MTQIPCLTLWNVIGCKAMEAVIGTYSLPIITDARPLDV